MLVAHATVLTVLELLPTTVLLLLASALEVRSAIRCHHFYMIRVIIRFEFAGCGWSHIRGTRLALLLLLLLSCYCANLGIARSSSSSSNSISVHARLAHPELTFVRVVLFSGRRVSK